MQRLLKNVLAGWLKLRKTMEENSHFEIENQMQHEENKEEMNCKNVSRTRRKLFMNQGTLRKKILMQQEELEKVKESSTNSINAEEWRRRDDEYLKFVEIQDKEMDSFVEKKEKLLKAHEDKLTAMRRRHWEEEA